MMVSDTNSAVNDVNCVGDIIHMMNVQDYADRTNQEINDERDYQRISKMYIKDETRESQKILLSIHSGHLKHCGEYGTMV